MGEESNNNDFKKLLKIHLSYVIKLNKIRQENDTIQKKITTLESELKAEKKHK